MQPEVLILDEPTAGLDPKGRDEILDQVAKLHKERGITVISGITQYGGCGKICRPHYCDESGKCHV